MTRKTQAKNYSGKHKTPRVTIQIPASLHGPWKRVAKIHKMSLKDFVVFAVTKYILEPP